MKDQPTYSDSQLVALLQQNDKPAQEYLIDKYAGALYGLVRQVLPKEEDVVEILAASFSRIVANIKHYNPSKSRLFTWMLQLTRETAIQKLKESNLRTLPVKTNQEGGHIIDELAKRLSKDKQELVVLSYFKGYSSSDLASRLNMTEESVKMELKLALSHLNKLL